jgi:hypothetical protein
MERPLVKGKWPLAGEGGPLRSRMRNQPETTDEGPSGGFDDESL